MNIIQLGSSFTYSFDTELWLPECHILHTALQYTLLHVLLSLFNSCLGKKTFHFRNKFSKFSLFLSFADVDVLQVDATSVTSSLEEPKRCGGLSSDAGKKELNGDTPKNGICQGSTGTPNATDDLRNYAYEGEGSSPGSLSSCELEGNCWCEELADEQQRVGNACGALP